MLYVDTLQKVQHPPLRTVPKVQGLIQKIINIFAIVYKKTKKLKKAYAQGQTVHSGAIIQRFLAEQVVFDNLVVVGSAGLSTSSVHSTLQKNMSKIRNLQQGLSVVL
jgi:hypothetical protein